MTWPMTATDATASLQSLLDGAAAKRAAVVIPAGGHRLFSTGLGYASNAEIVLKGDLYNDHGPLVGTLYCLTNRTKGRLSNVTVVGQGGAFAGAESSPNGATRKGLGIVATDGFHVSGVQTRGPLNGFGMEVKNSTAGVLNGLTLMSGVNRPGADGLHFFGACSRVTGSRIVVSSGDDALSFTCENSESTNALMERISLSGLTLDSAAFSSIKFYTGPNTGKATIRNIRLAAIKGRITQGPTGCPLMMQNDGAAHGCVIDDVVISGCDLDFGAATQEGPTAYLTDITRVSLLKMVLRGRRNGQFLRAVRCKGLKLQGECWDTIGGSSMSDLVQLEQCGAYSIDLVIRSANGTRIGSVQASNPGTDAGTRYIGLTGT